MASQEKFWDGIADRYARRDVRDAEAYATTLERTRAHLQPGDRVLELGSGTGTTALTLAKGVAHLTGTDVSGRMVAIAESRADEAQAPNVEFRHGGFPTDAPEGPFDVVLAFNLLHLLDDLPGALAEVRARLVPGGRFISKTPCLGDGMGLRIALRAMQLFGLAPPLNRLDPDGLVDAIAAAGFEIVETGDYPADPPSRFVVARLPDAAP